LRPWDIDRRDHEEGREVGVIGIKEGSGVMGMDLLFTAWNIGGLECEMGRYYVFLRM